jgi:hypothetical protein
MGIPRGQHMIKRWLKRFIAGQAKSSKDVNIQIMCCFLHGALDVFGVGGTVVLFVKARRNISGKQNAMSKSGRV